MTELIDVVQKQDPGSELVTLFELNFNGTTLYFHPGLDDNLDKLYFEDATQRLISILIPYVEIIGKLSMVVAGAYIAIYWLVGDGSELLRFRLKNM